MTTATRDPSCCVILVPVGGRIEPACDDALRQLEGRGYPVRRVYGYSAIDQGRNAMATRALADGFAELMWIDADIGFDPADVDRLRAHDLPLSCAIYPKKGPRSFAFNFRDDTRQVRFGRDGGLLEIARAGFGFTHTRREVYEQIAVACELPACNEVFGEKMLPYFMPMVVADRIGHSYLAEDFAFCERASRAGVKIMADTRIRLWHIGNYAYGWEDAGRDVERYGDYTFHVQRG